MFQVSFTIAAVCCSVLISTAYCQPSYILPQPRNEAGSVTVVEQIPSNSYEYQVVPTGEYAVAEVPETSILDYVLSPMTAIVSVASTALSVATWMFINGGLVLLGMGIVIGFCALTPYCTMIIEKPSFLAREYISSIPYLDELEYYISEAYNKYHEMQKSV